MGCLHEGHLSLIKRARRESDIVVLSIYVNPLQFGPKEDYKVYPCNFKEDKILAYKEGVDFIFLPDDKSMYPTGFQTEISVKKLSRGLCGKSRPGHFNGVSMVVVKLFNIVRPDIAYFGQKDFQQTQVIKQMIKDLNMSLKIKVLPIMRGPDGLALSSRNKYLTFSEKRKACVLYKSLLKAKRMIKNGSKDTKKIKKIMREMIKKNDIKVDYIEILDPETLKEKNKVDDRALIALAVKIGRARLIDNILLKV